jgi:rapamycin-insensitive companion of mTOR
MGRTDSTGQDSFVDGVGPRSPWSRSNSEMDILRAEVYQDDENMGILVDTVSVTLRRLREISRRMGKGKGKEVERGDEPWECLTRVADMLKKCVGLKGSINIRELVQRYVPFLLLRTLS